MVMPRMNGRDCFFTFKKLNPNVKVVLSSGFSMSEHIKEMIDHGLAGFLRKPYRSEDLYNIVAKIMAQP